MNHVGPDEARRGPPPVYFIGGGQSDTNGVIPESAGLKGHNLMRLDRMGLPVPPAFVLSPGHWNLTGDEPRIDRGALVRVLPSAIRQLENVTGGRFGSQRRPLIVSVRSSASVSMPGMMSSVLNVGLNGRTVHGLIRRTGNPRLAWDAYRRLVRGLADLQGADAAGFDRMLAQRVEQDGLDSPRELDATALAGLAEANLRLYRDLQSNAFPEQPIDQLTAAVEGVAASWFTPRAREYRRVHGVDGVAGMAIIVQAMVFGNAGLTSGSGVAFTRNPATGEDELYIDFLCNAQGDDVVGGQHAILDTDVLPRILGSVYESIEGARRRLEREFRDVQDVEFTVQDGALYFLQTRDAKRTPHAAVRIAVDMANEGVIDRATALDRVAGLSADDLKRVYLVTGGHDPVGRGTPASVGVAVGAIALDPAHVRALAEQGRPVVLVRETTNPDDVAGMEDAVGVLTALGGRTSHAAVIARQLGKVSIVGCRSLRVDPGRRRCAVGGVAFDEGDDITLDGDTGAVYAGRMETRWRNPGEDWETIQRWRQGAERSPAAMSG